MINENEKYFLNSSHAALNSFQSSGRITRDIRFSPRLGLHPNFCSISLRKNFVYPKRYVQFENPLKMIRYNLRSLPQTKNIKTRTYLFNNWR
mgnify:CR=1 FL=1